MKTTTHFKLSDSIGHVMNITANKIRAELERAFLERGYEISAHQWMILGIIYENEGISQNELANLGEKEKTNIARIVEKLEHKGYITRERAHEDRRVMRLFATENGKVLREELSKVAFSVLERASRGISSEEQRACMETLRRIYNNLV